MRVLITDIETSPSVAHVWSLWRQNVSLSQLQVPTEMMSFAAKWRGEKKVFFHSNHHDGHDEMVARAHALFDEADVVVTYNGDNFDIPHMRREFIETGLTPPSPFRSVDLCKVVKKEFRFISNKLQHVATELGLGGKVEHTGHEMWVRALAGDEKAWTLFKKYNIGDVRLTEALLERLLPWISTFPPAALYDGAEAEQCNRCGSEDLKRRGYAFTTLGKYQRFQCRGCGGWLRSGKRLAAVELRGVK